MYWRSDSVSQAHPQCSLEFQAERTQQESRECLLFAEILLGIQGHCQAQCSSKRLGRHAALFCRCPARWGGDWFGQWQYSQLLIKELTVLHPLTCTLWTGSGATGSGECPSVSVTGLPRDFCTSHTAFLGLNFSKSGLQQQTCTAVPSTSPGGRTLGPRKSQILQSTWAKE